MKLDMDKSDVLVLRLDGTEERVLCAHPFAARLVVYVGPGERYECMRETTRHPSGTHGPFESAFVVDEETGAVYELRFREVTIH